MGTLAENAERHLFIHTLDYLVESLVIAGHLLEPVPFAGYGKDSEPIED